MKIDHKESYTEEVDLVIANENIHSRLQDNASYLTELIDFATAHLVDEGEVRPEAARKTEARRRVVRKDAEFSSRLFHGVRAGSLAPGTLRTSFTPAYRILASTQDANNATAAVLRSIVLGRVPLRLRAHLAT